MPTDKRVVLLLVTLLAVFYGATESARYGDATSYANEIVLGRLIEPGHLLWRPLGAMVAHIAGLAASRSAVLWVLEALSLLCALVTGVSLFLVARRVSSFSTALIVTALAALSNGFWTYSFSGCSYALSEMLLVLALYFAVCAISGGTTRGRDEFLVGVFGGLAASAWAIQVIAGPALLALVLFPVSRDRGHGDRLARVLRVVAGFALSCAIPLLVLYAFRDSIGGAAYVLPGPNSRSFLGWLSSADHGIDSESSVAQLFRVAIGWAQSFVSIGNLGQELRLWLFHEVAFPLSAGLATLTVFYAAAAVVVATLARDFAMFDAPRRAIVVATVIGTAVNLLFGYLWQGTDLERYFPSLPFQALAVALVVEHWRACAPRAALSAAACVVVLAAALTWFGNFHESLSPGSLRKTWERALASHCHRDDAVFVLGYGKFGIGDPHDQNFPTVVNVSSVIALEGDRWRIPIGQTLANTRAHYGRVFIGSSVLRRDSAPREGWSFTQHPHPSATEIADYFRYSSPLQPAFAVNGEQVWLAPGP